MSAKDYNKADSVGFGDAVNKLIDGISGNGVGADDLGNLIGAVTASATVINEAKDVPVAFGCHVGARIMDHQGDNALERAIASETSPE